MTLGDILQSKGGTIHSISPDASLADVVAKLVENNEGSLVVCEGDRLLGIITERDILRACASLDHPLSAMRVADHMTREVITGKLGDSVDNSMGILTHHRVRHLPVLDAGRLAGMISIGDLVKAHYDQLQMENHYLKSYIQS